MSEAAEGKPKRTRRRRRRIVLLVLLVLVLASGAGYYRFYLSRPVGSGPAGPAVPVEAFEKTWSDRKVVLFGMGDSVTAGYGASPGLSYFERLAENPPDEFEDIRGACLSAVFPNLETMNTAVSTSTSLQHEKYLAEVEPFPADVLGIVVMTTGGNDILHDYGRSPPREDAMFGATLEQARPWIDAFEKRLDRMIGMLRDRFPGGCHVFVATVYDPSDGSDECMMQIAPFYSVGLPAWPDGQAVLKAVNDVIARCAARHAFVHLVDTHREFLGHGIHCTKFWKSTYRSDDPTFWYLMILEDPNDRGYDAIRRLMLLKMIEVLRP